MLAACLIGCERVPQTVSVPADTLEAGLQVLIGETDGAPEYLLGRIVGVAVSRGGVTYVADDIGTSVRAYDQAGRYLGTVGSEGDGPGGFRYLLSLDIDPSGSLHVRGAFLSTFNFAVEDGGARWLVLDDEGRGIARVSVAPCPRAVRILPR